MEKSYINLIYLPEKELMSDQKYVHNCMSLIVIIINHPVFKRLALYLDFFILFHLWCKLSYVNKKKCSKHVIIMLYYMLTSHNFLNNGMLNNLMFIDSLTLYTS